MLKITLEGPRASGKTLMHEVIKAHMAEVTAKTGHGIEVVEMNMSKAGAESRHYPKGEVPNFKVYRFKPSGKYDIEFDLLAPNTNNMNAVSKLLRETKKMPAGYSMVIAAPNNQMAEDFFFPIEVKDESSSN